MKIFILNNLYEPYARGGAERIAKIQAEGLAARGHDVAIITTRPFSRENFFKTEKETRGGIRIFRFFPWNFFWYGNDFRHGFFARFTWHIFDILNVQSALEIDSILQKEKPDAVITHNLTGLGFLIPAMIRSRGARHIHVLHDVQLLNPSGLVIAGEEHSPMNEGIFASLYRAVTRRFLGSPEAVVSPSEWLLREHERYGFFPASEKQTLRNPAPNISAAPRSEHRGLRLSFIGQLEKHKGILWLTETFRKISDPDIVLNIAGTGSVEAEARRLAEGDSRIVFSGKLSSEGVAALLSQTDAVVMPSLCYENSPTVVYESFAAGVPVIASNLGGIPELVKDGETGWLFKAGDAEALVKIFKESRSRSEALWEMGGRAREFLRPFGDERYLDTLENILKT